MVSASPQTSAFAFPTAADGITLIELTGQILSYNVGVEGKIVTMTGNYYHMTYGNNYLIITYDR